MKKFTIILFLIGFSILKIQAQDYYLTFAAAGDTTVVNTVKVENLTSGATITLNGGDILHLIAPVGIRTTDFINGTLQVNPNPMVEQSNLTFSSPENGNATISIIDLSGKTICQLSIFLSAGMHSFQVSGISQGFYCVQVTGGNYAYTAKLVSNSNIQGKVRIECVSLINYPVAEKLKSTLTTIDMTYTNGDILLFKGVSGRYSTVVTNVPTSNEIITFNFVLCQDSDGKNYSVVQVGTQTWMAENLNVGIKINGTQNQTNNGIIEKYCFNNMQSNCDVYGGLYQWDEMMQYCPSRHNSMGLCPYGWIVPSDDDWTVLSDYLQGESVAGGKMKETGTDHWASPNNGATNSSGFTALPGGLNSNYLTFRAYFWSVSEYNTTDVWSRYLLYDYPDLTSDHYPKTNGYSVRCMKSSGFFLGQSYGGGIIFYIDSTGQHGLIAANVVQSAAEWGCYGTVTWAQEWGIGKGQSNTTTILSHCNTPGIAAQVCDALVLNGYSDWYLPSIYELQELCLQKNLFGGFPNQTFWSSTESEDPTYSPFQAYYLDFNYPFWIDILPKNTSLSFVAIRSF
jgi:uncharacterized protein (TIGR02145 family)